MADDNPRPQFEYPYAPPAPLTTHGQDAASPEPTPGNRFTDFAGQVEKKAAPATSALYVWGLAALWLLTSAIVNLAAVPVSEAIVGEPSSFELVLAFGLGLIGSQMLILSGALVWSNRHFLLRLVVLWLVGLALYSCWYLGLAATYNRDHWFREEMMQVARAILASLFAVSLAIQAPQWLARFYFAWAIAAPAPGAGGEPVRPMSIRDFLVGTVVVALTVAPMRLAFEDPHDATPEFWAAWAVAAIIVAAASAGVNLPLLYLVLRLRDPTWALAFIFLGSPLIGGAVIAAIFAIQNDGPDAWGIAMSLFAFTACVAATSLPLWLARLAGYRLAIRGDVPVLDD
jgi:hypothetical protein